MRLVVRCREPCPEILFQIVAHGVRRVQRVLMKRHHTGSKCNRRGEVTRALAVEELIDAAYQGSKSAIELGHCRKHLLSFLVEGPLNRDRGMGRSRVQLEVT